jgi:Homeobox KN domain
MAASYTSHRPSYQAQQLDPNRHNPGLPSIRDIDQTIGKFSNFNNGFIPTNAYLETYGQPMPNSQGYYNESLTDRRPSSSVYENKNISQTYPPAHRYPPMKTDHGHYAHSAFEPYSTRGPYDYAPYTPTSISPAGIICNPSGETGDSRNRRRRGNLPKHITDILRAWFQDHLDHPYPSEEEKQMFIQQTGLSMNQVSSRSLVCSRGTSELTAGFRSATGSSTPADGIFQLCDKPETVVTKEQRNHHGTHDRTLRNMHPSMTDVRTNWSPTFIATATTWEISFACMHGKGGARTRLSMNILVHLANLEWQFRVEEMQRPDRGLESLINLSVGRHLNGYPAGNTLLAHFDMDTRSTQETWQDGVSTRARHDEDGDNYENCLACRPVNGRDHWPWTLFQSLQ